MTSIVQQFGPSKHVGLLGIKISYLFTLTRRFVDISNAREFSRFDMHFLALEQNIDFNLQPLRNTKSAIEKDSLLIFQIRRDLVNFGVGL